MFLACRPSTLNPKPYDSFRVLSSKGAAYEDAQVNGATRDTIGFGAQVFEEVPPYTVRICNPFGVQYFEKRILF